MLTTAGRLTKEVCERLDAVVLVASAEVAEPPNNQPVYAVGWKPDANAGFYYSNLTPFFPTYDELEQHLAKHIDRLRNYGDDLAAPYTGDWD